VRITGTTGVVAIIGDPVAHTVSPEMHNAAFEALGVDMVYAPFRVPARPASALERAIAGMRALGMKGANITIPHKERVLDHLDGVDEHAREVGAVNTVVNRDGRLLGYNTDGPGYLLSLREETGFTPAGKDIVIIGAGGAARSIFFALLCGRPASVVIANRTLKRAESLAAELRERFSSTDIKTAALGREALERHLMDADILINTTSLGMVGWGELTLPLDGLPGRAIVSDIVYRPVETGLIRDARSRGLAVHGGLSMLVRQGAISFELWTGRKAPVDVMMKAARAALG
jgi:shikimate dehydrogenase